MALVLWARAGSGQDVGRGTGAPAAWPPAVYTARIEARYDEATRGLAGRQVLEWRNTSSAPVEHLELHLYLNAFANNRSTFMLESKDVFRGEAPGEDGWGWIEVRSVRLADGTDLEPTERFVQPEDGNPDDRTVVAYDLPTPLPPGATATLALEWDARLPAIVTRTGVDGDFVIGGQWFPKIGVLEDAGVRGRSRAGWNARQYHALSEFYADFGDYDVTLDLPARFAGKTGATGALAGETTAGDRVRVRYVARAVHDFVWTADPRFEVVEDRFDPARDVPPVLLARVAAQLGRQPSELALSPVELRLLVHPRNRFLAPTLLQAAKAALAGLGLRLGAYPYPGLTLVVPPPGAGGASAMEYPTLITLGGTRTVRFPLLGSTRIVETITVHEVAHQWFYGMLASSEPEESWLDEGMASFYETRVLQDTYGPWLGRPLGIRVPFDSPHRTQLFDFLDDPIVTASWRFRSARAWGAASYGRPAILLRQLEGMVGEAAFARAMRAYVERYRWRHPETADFERTFVESLGAAPAVPAHEVENLLFQALHTTRVLDYAVAAIDNREVPALEGHSFRPADDPEPRHEKGSFRSTADVVRRGELSQPVAVRFRFENGDTVTLRWDGDERWRRFSFTRPSRLASAEVDPDGRLAMDVDRLNDSRAAEAASAPRFKFLAHLSFLLQSFFQTTWLFT